MTHYDDPLWTIIALLVIVLAAVWANSREQSRRTNGSSNSEKPQEDTSRPPDIKRSPDTFSSRTDANDRGNTEKAIKNWTMVLAIATAIGSVFALFTLNAIRGQLAEMQEDGRPWVQGSIKFVGPLVFDQSGANAPIILSLKNSGRSPAKNVWRGVRMYAGDGPDTLIMGWEKCTLRTDRSRYEKGNYHFPKRIPGSRLPVGINSLDVAKNINVDGEIIVRIILCVDYAFSSSREHHQTSYIWEIDRSNPSTDFTHLKPSDGTIQPNELLMLSDPSLPGRTT